MRGVEEHESVAAEHEQSFALPPVPPPIRAERRAVGTTPPPPKAAAPVSTVRSPLASANPVQNLGPAAVVKSTPANVKWVVGGVLAVVIVCLGIFGVMVGREVAGFTLIENLEQGQCVEDFFQESPNGEFVEVFFVRTVDCTEPHAYEVYAASDLLWADEFYPGIENAFTDGDVFCNSQFESFTRTDYFSSPYEFLTFVPTAEMWASGDRTVRCLIGEADGFTLTTGSLRDSGLRVGS